MNAAEVRGIARIVEVSFVSTFNKNRKTIY